MSSIRRSLPRRSHHNSTTSPEWQRKPRKVQILSATLLALAGATAHAAELDATADFYLKVDATEQSNGVLVSDLIAQDTANVTTEPVLVGASGDGIAISDIDTSTGSWDYQDPSALSPTWTPIYQYDGADGAHPDGVRTSNALLLAKTARIRFTPGDANTYNQSTADYASGHAFLTFKTFDVTGQSVDLNNPTLLSFSTYSGGVTLNRAPTINQAGQTTDFSNASIVATDPNADIGITIDQFIADQDPGNLLGLAVTTAYNGDNGDGYAGNWEAGWFNNDGGSWTWQSISPQFGTAYLIGSPDKIRFHVTAGLDAVIPDHRPSLTFQAWDQTNIGSGITLGSFTWTAFSRQQRESTIAIFAQRRVLSGQHHHRGGSQSCAHVRRC